MPASADRPPVADVDRLNRVRGTDHAPDLGGVVQERLELAPGALPEPGDGRIPLAPFAAELGETFLGGLFSRRGVNRPQIAGHLVPVSAAQRKVLRIKWITHVWITAAGHTVLIASSSPLSPSQTTIHTLAVPGPAQGLIDCCTASCGLAVGGCGLCRRLIRWSSVAM